MRIKKLIDKILYNRWLYPLVKKICYHYYPKDIIGVNLDLTKKNQRRILICYVSPLGVDILSQHHAAYFHLNQMIKVLSDKGFVLDICQCDDLRSHNRIKQQKYYAIIGQGPLFLQLINIISFKKKILFCTENNPDIVKAKYNERINYFKERHPLINYKNAVVRNGYILHEHLVKSDDIILINSDYNAKSFSKYFGNIHTINVNAILNDSFIFKENIDVCKIKNNFVMFGCNGIIHKGLDILFDVFRELPCCTLNVFGVSPLEKDLFKSLHPKNVIDKGNINVMGPEFLSEVINNNLFVVLPSCSEGMASGVATCMVHGLIPLITKECGFNDDIPQIRINSFKVYEIKKNICNLLMMPDQVLLEKRKEVYFSSRKNFSIEKFTVDFNSIVDSLL